MDPRALLESLLQSGKELAEKGLESGKGLAEQTLESGKGLVEKGRDLAEDKLGLPEGEAGDKAMANLGKGAAVGGLLALLLGTERGRKIAAPAAKLGGLAALGGLAYKVFKDHQAKSGATEEIGQPVSELSADEGNVRSISLIRAMIAAAKADGYVDASEQTRLAEEIEILGLEAELATSLKDELAQPLDVAQVAALADSPAAAAEIYLASRMVLDVDRQSERSYLDQLAAALKLDGSLVNQLEVEATAA